LIPENFFKVKPWQHQSKGVIEASKSNDGYAFFFEVGTGKTMTAISTLRMKYMEYGSLRKTLILGPVIVLENWKRELLAHSNLKEENIHVLHGPGKKRIEKLKEIEDDIVITNYEALSSIKGFTEAIQKWEPEILVLDESHRCKNIQAKMTKACIKIADKAEHSYLLSGTPILNSLIDIFAQYRILDKGKTFGKSVFSFRNKYFYDKNAGMSRDKYFPDWIAKKESADEINALVKAKSMHVKKSDCLDLPPLVKKKIYVELEPDQKKAYADLMKNFIAFVSDDTQTAAVAELALTKALRLQQITTGFVGTEDVEGKKDIHRFKKNPRKKALQELLADLTPNHKVIVWAVFKENYKDIREVCEKLGVEHAEVHGSVSQQDKLFAMDSFNNDEKCRVLIGHPGSGGIGINLVSSDVSVFYSRNFSLEYDIQAEARNYRGGSERHEKVTRYDLVTPNTIDEQVLSALQDKKKIGYKVLKDMALKENG